MGRRHHRSKRETNKERNNRVNLPLRRPVLLLTPKETHNMAAKKKTQKSAKKSMKFIIEIGDWSRDGHNQSEEFIAIANGTIEQVREAYFEAQDKLPEEIHPDKFVKHNQDNVVQERVMREMVENGYECGYNLVSCTPDDLVDYTVWFINQGNKNLKVRLQFTELAPRLHFYGYDSKKRHIEGIGYGLFT